MFDSAISEIGGWAMVIVNSISSLITQLISAIPMLIVALLIWWIGQWVIDKGLMILKKFDLKNTKFDNKLISTLSPLLSLFGRFILVLMILDYLGIGENVVGAVANGLTFAIAIALGLAFGKALEPDAKMIHEHLKGIIFEKKSK